MTKLLQQAFDEASKLPAAEQDLLASWLLDELADDDDFDRAIASSPETLVRMASKALAEFRSGETQELDPDRL